MVWNEISQDPTINFKRFSRKKNTIWTNPVTPNFFFSQNLMRICVKNKL